MTNLQLGLIAGGAALVLGVVVYNWLQERRVRRRIEAAFRPAGATTGGTPAPAGHRVEPSLRRGEDADGESYGDGGTEAADAEAAATGTARSPFAAADAVDAVADDVAEDWQPPVDTIGVSPAPAAAAPMSSAATMLGHGRAASAKWTAAPDPDIESIITLQPTRPVPAGAVAAGLHARLGKPLRWFGRHDADSPWQQLRADTSGEYAEFAACLLLADRAGSATAPTLAAFVALARDIAPTLPGAFAAPDPAAEAERAEALDRICADLDVQVGLTVLKASPATITGTRLRGVAEAAGFRLGERGRFEWVQEETGAVLYSLQNYRSEPFTVDTLRVASTPGVVLLLDVARVADPVRAFDQMKLAAKRMALTLDGELVDDNRRPLDDAALAAIRPQVQAAAVALRETNIEPGSPRAQSLFGD
jgi:hypothetical protein